MCLNFIGRKANAWHISSVLWFIATESKKLFLGI